MYQIFSILNSVKIMFKVALVKEGIIIINILDRSPFEFKTCEQLTCEQFDNLPKKDTLFYYFSCNS